MISKIEKVGGTGKYETVKYYAELYCNVLKLTPQQKELFLRGERVVVTDTSALLKNPQLINELGREYGKVVVPKIVVDELDYIKDHNVKGQKTNAWRLLKRIGAGGNVVKKEDGLKHVQGRNNDIRIIACAQKAAEEYHCEVDLITNDVGFSARLNGNETVHALFLGDYVATKQHLTNMEHLEKLNNYYADSYEDVERVLKIQVPDRKNINVHFSNGYTLIISVVRNRNKPIQQRKEKIRWLIENGADVNKRDNAKYYFPPLTHAVQNGDLEMFRFLLHECGADPNIGSRNPYDSGKIYQKNEGNMPLMVAAWGNKIEFVRELCADPRTSLNQQDANGFTALIKACYRGNRECVKMLLDAGADEKIVDRDDFTAREHYEAYLRNERKKGFQQRCRKNSGRSRHAYHD
jgi:rRNA-processing protein FCF1